MSAVIRVKRRFDEDPLDALVLNCKRRKTNKECSSATDLSAILKFAGTTERQEDDVLQHIKCQTKSKIEENFKGNSSSIKDKLRDEILFSSKTNRYKIVNLRRSNTAEDNAAATPITIVDIEINIEAFADNSKYVYDLYYSNTDEIGDVTEHDLIGVYPLSDELVYGTYRDNGLMDSDNESEDSNDENNWRNDYPDEEDAESITQDDMLAAMNTVGLEDKENDLSSSDGEEGFIYSIDSESAGFEEDIDQSDVHRYGERYARFKARHKDLTSDNSVEYDYDDEDDEYKECYD